MPSSPRPWRAVALAGTVCSGGIWRNGGRGSGPSSRLHAQGCVLRCLPCCFAPIGPPTEGVALSATTATRCFSSSATRLHACAPPQMAAHATPTSPRRGGGRVAVDVPLLQQVGEVIGRDARHDAGVRGALEAEQLIGGGPNSSARRGGPGQACHVDPKPMERNPAASASVGSPHGSRRPARVKHLCWARR